ncbi:MAG: inner rane protein YihY, formerly thought to be RNase [Chitinophagaceae bacterium]|jgi:membrane protein|nr:inner rane protein YihY, formerly thought to be RNase [Chitinophagaceae bacterium]
MPLNTIRSKTKEETGKLRRFIKFSAPVRFARDRSRVLFLPGFKGISLYDVSRYFWMESKRLGLRERAAAVSFNFLMAIPAGLIFMIALVPYMPIPEQFHAQLITLIKDLVRNPDTQAYVVEFVEDFFRNTQTGLLSIGFLLAIFYSSNAIMVIIRTFDRSLHKKIKPKFLRKRLRAIRLTTVVMAIFIGTIFLLLGQGVFFKWMMDEMSITDAKIKWLIDVVRWVAILLLFMYAIGFIYRNAPSIEKKWRLISPGTILATALTYLTTFLFSLWVEHFNRFNELYGSIGTTMILMLLVYLNSLILLIGFELNVCIDFLRDRADERLLNETNGLENAAKPPKLGA